MTQSRLVSADERIIESMIGLAHCSKPERVLVAGVKGIELMFALHRLGYVRAAATANCGHAARQYAAALVDWRHRPVKALDSTVDWLVDYLAPAGVLVVFVEPQKPAAIDILRSVLERHGFRVEAKTADNYGFAISARRAEVRPLSKAA